jgi:hypothetical protein
MADDDSVDDAIERWMRQRASPAPPAGFTSAVMARVRQERWRAERYWDVGFNVAVGGGLVLVVAGILGLIYMSGLAAVGRDVMLLFGEAVTTVAEQISPVLPVYMGALLLTASALGLWWYVENY